MELEKEAFVKLMDYYKQLPIDLKKKEIIDKLENMILIYSNMCASLNVVPNMSLKKEMLKLNKNSSEDDFLHAVFAYLNTLEEINAEFINKICDETEK